MSVGSRSSPSDPLQSTLCPDDLVNVMRFLEPWHSARAARVSRSFQRAVGIGLLERAARLGLEMTKIGDSPSRQLDRLERQMERVPSLMENKECKTLLQFDSCVLRLHRDAFISALKQEGDGFDVKLWRAHAVHMIQLGLIQKWGPDQDSLRWLDQNWTDIARCLKPEHAYARHIVVQIMKHLPPLKIQVCASCLW